jgi:hypothetical protein
MEINGFRGIGSDWETGLANVFIAKGAAFAARARLSFISGTMKIVLSIKMSPLPLSLIGIFTASGRAGVKGVSGGRRSGTINFSDIGS